MVGWQVRKRKKPQAHKHTKRKQRITRTTWESLPLKPLPGRLNIVLTRDEGWGEDGQAQSPAKGALVCRTLDEAIEIAREQAEDDGVDEVCVIGGTALFAAALPRARRLYVTEVEADVEGDATFPPIHDCAGFGTLLPLIVLSNKMENEDLPF